MIPALFEVCIQFLIGVYFYCFFCSMLFCSESNFLTGAVLPFLCSSYMYHQCVKCNVECFFSVV